jgi:hypothetical protein
VEYDETDNARAVRDFLQNGSDGKLDDVHSIRNDKNADIVIMIVENGNGYSGYSFTMETISPDFSEFAFAVVQRTAAISNLSFPHELGHIMGAKHNCSDSEPAIPGTNNRGYFSGALETIMSGNAVSTRVENWSNPNVFFPGTTRASGTNTGNCPAFNVQTFQNSVSVVSKFRCRNPIITPDQQDETDTKEDDSTTGPTTGCPLWSRCFWIAIITAIFIVGLIVLLIRRRRRNN